MKAYHYRHRQHNHTTRACHCFVGEDDEEEDQETSSNATLKCGKKKYRGGITNLPTYIETFKTFDKQNFYKSADISQDSTVAEYRHDV